MPTVDLLFVAILLVSMVIGAWRGLAYEVLSLLGWVAAFVAAQYAAPDAAQALALVDLPEPVQYAIGFVAVFIVTVLLAGLLALVLKKMLAAVGLRPVDRALGALFGLLRGCVVLLTATVVAMLTPVAEQESWAQAQGPQWARATLVVLKPWLPEKFGKYLPEK